MTHNPLRHKGRTPVARAMALKFADRLSAVAPSATLSDGRPRSAPAARGAQGLSLQRRRARLRHAGATSATPPRRRSTQGAPALHRRERLAGAQAARSAPATERDRGWRPSPNRSWSACGAKHALFNLALALYRARATRSSSRRRTGSATRSRCRLVGATPVLVDDAGGRRASASTPEALEAAITPRTKARHPLHALEPDRLGLLGARSPRRSSTSCASSDLLAHRRRDLRRPHLRRLRARLAPRARGGSARPHRSSSTACRKTYAMTGWRIGWSITPPELAKVLDGAGPEHDQRGRRRAGRAAVGGVSTGPQDELRGCATPSRAGVSGWSRASARIPGVSCRMPEGAFYAFADVPWPSTASRTRAARSDATSVSMMAAPKHAHVAERGGHALRRAGLPALLSLAQNRTSRWDRDHPRGDRRPAMKSIVASVLVVHSRAGVVGLAHRAHNSTVECILHTDEVAGSIPAAP